MVIYSITMDATDRVFCLVIYHLIFCMFTRPLGTKITKFPTLYFPYKSVDHCRKDNDIIWDLPLEISFNICGKQVDMKWPNLVQNIARDDVFLEIAKNWNVNIQLERGNLYNSNGATYVQICGILREIWLFYRKLPEMESLCTGHSGKDSWHRLKRRMSGLFIG